MKESFVDRIKSTYSIILLLVLVVSLTTNYMQCSKFSYFEARANTNLANNVETKECVEKLKTDVAATREKVVVLEAQYKEIKDQLNRIESKLDRQR